MKALSVLEGRNKAFPFYRLFCSFSFSYAAAESFWKWHLPQLPELSSLPDPVFVLPPECGLHPAGPAKGSKGDSE